MQTDHIYIENNRNIQLQLQLTLKARHDGHKQKSIFGLQDLAEKGKQLITMDNTDTMFPDIVVKILSLMN